ncbi:ethanolamine kinase [Lasallia pustulata]|uniref:Ethanolamine kinase n=1 Tax=Lasallia pustulata TaxID=136370 RepID=A0A1W5D5W6_9LECA|nr:ethanolamine kinase [Lasallia pustulata]
MRELHEGIDLLKEERDNGAFVWLNWDKWVSRCEQVVTWLDEQILKAEPDSAKKTGDAWKSKGLVCGVEWPVFRRTVDTYRAWLDASLGGKAGVREQLVFAHNDVPSLCSEGLFCTRMG